LSIADGPRRGIVLEVGTATVGRMQEALAERQRSGAIERVHRSYVQG
jgi:hypothetical protein